MIYHYVQKADICNFAKILFMRILVFLVVLCVALSQCKPSGLSPEKEQELLSDPNLYHETVSHLTDVIVHDIFSPPVASRVYVYPNIAAYEIIAKYNADYPSLSGQLNGLNEIPKAKEGVSHNLAAVYAHLICGKTLVFSEDKMNDFLSNLNNSLDSIGVSQKTQNASMDYAKTVAKHILLWADKDNYKETRSAPKFSISDNPGEWKPTPPAYMEGIEPHWRKIRTLVLTSADQFKPAAPPEFNMTKGSDFYNKTVEVMDAVNNATEEHIKIASFWDCNPYVMNQTGHMMFASKKITPGGHWIGIASIASKKANHDIAASIATNTMTSIALFDGFISCWDEKYRSNLIRPETVINEYIDESWKPILQTPPFPEHTSGHSVISNAAATVLTALVGDNFQYTDDVEVKYGLEQRDFNSFNEASAQAAISRLYGGIHYMPAITDGITQGQEVGKYIIENVSVRLKS